MHRIDTSTAQVDKFGAGKNGFTGGNPQTGELPTALDETFFDSIQEEICSVIEGAGIVLAKGTRNQLLSALKSNLVFFTDTGTANAIVISPTPAVTALVNGQAFDIACAAANTGAVTLKVNALNAYPVIGPVGALQGGEIAANGVIRVIWSASNNAFLMTGQNTKGPLQVAPATQTYHAVQLTQLSAAISAALLLHGQVEITASTTWTCPAGVTTIWVDACAPGGGGAYSASGTTGGGGGGGGQSVTGQAITVSPGTTYSITIGSPGNGGTSSSVNGTQGGNTTFGSLLTLTGGFGGLSAGNGGAAGGTGGTGGIAGNLSGGISFGGAGGSSNYGAGGPGGSGAAFGQIGGGFGSGGGGGGNGSGSRGGYGFVRIWW